MANTNSVRARLTSAFRRLPVTFAIVLIAASLYASTVYLSLFEPTTLPRHEYPGAMTVLQMTAFPEVHGPFELWQGEAWRLLFNAMHHAGLWHVLLNAMSLWILGDMLEPHMGRVRYLLFFIVACYVSVLAQLLIGDMPIGMSGAVYAVFGYLVAIRKYDQEIEYRMPPAMLKMGFGCLVLFVPLTAAGLLNIANLAHFAGVGYGWILGRLSSRFTSRARWRKRMAVVVVHAGIIGLTFVAMNPFWDGRFQAWMAFKESDYRTQLDRWREATSIEPGIAVAWLGQAEILYDIGQEKEAWKTALNGLRLNPTDEKLDRFVRDRWEEWRFHSNRTETALTDLREVFKEQSDAWIRRLKLEGPPPIPNRVDMAELLALLEEKKKEKPRLDAKLDIPQDVAGITSPHPPLLKPGEVNPKARDSALLGETL